MNMAQKSSLIPPNELIVENGVGIGDYAKIAEDFVKIGDGIVGRMIREGFIEESSNVLDVGCGLGRLARPLTKFLTSGKYVGIDITQTSIIWCKDNYAEFNNFDFEFANIFSTYYNPTSTVKATEYEFPFPDEAFDFVWSTSLFTHMLINEVDNYLSQMSRVMKLGAHCWNTYLLLNDVSLECMNAGEAASRVKLEYPVEGGLVRDLANPEAQIGLFEDRILAIHEKYGLEIVEPIRYGPWSGRKDGILAGFQDIIIAKKVR